MRERGSTDMKVENELLRAQLEEHKRFVSCFKSLCDGAPPTLNAKHKIYKGGSDSAQAHVLGLISQSQMDDWIEATYDEDVEMPSDLISDDEEPFNENIGRFVGQKERHKKGFYYREYEHAVIVYNPANKLEIKLRRNELARGIKATTLKSGEGVILYKR